MSSKRKRDEKDTRTNIVPLDPADRGHRWGNFHNYYNFHPPDERLSILKRKDGILDIVLNNETKSPFRYLDVGANEGNVTIEVAKEIRTRIGKRELVAKGLEIDRELVDRANAKVKEMKVDFDCQFREANILDDNDEEHRQLPKADLVTLFSTTMWIHIQGGDDGLRSALSRLCNACEGFLVVEPQPSSKYRTAAKRLQGMGRPPVDISSERLTMRANIEDQIESYVLNQGFERIQLPENIDERTSWNRLLRLYRKL